MYHGSFAKKVMCAYRGTLYHYKVTIGTGIQTSNNQLYTHPLKSTFQ